jgi:hypothetical protein
MRRVGVSTMLRFPRIGLLGRFALISGACVAAVAVAVSLYLSDAAQGYLWGRPAPAEELESLLDDANLAARAA